MPLQLPKPPKMHCSRISGVSRDSFCWNICAGRSKAPKSEIAFTARNHFALSLNCSIVPAAARLPIHDAPAPCFPRCAMPGCFVLSPGHDRHDRISDDRRFPILSTADDNLTSSLERLFEPVRIPSIFDGPRLQGGMPQGGGVAGQDAFSARLYGLRARYGRPPYGGGAS